MKITGKSESYARKEINSIKALLKKEKHQKVTIEEYCDYYGFKKNNVEEILFKSKLLNAS
jgi:hypothetical protein